MVGGQAILILMRAPFWVVAAPAVLMAYCVAVSTFNYEHGALKKPLRWYATSTLLAVAAAASFWFAPSDLSFKLQEARVCLLDVAAICIAGGIAAHARELRRPE